MEILKIMNWDWIFNKLIFLFFIYLYYIIILNNYCTYCLDNFEKKYCEKIKNRNLYFLGLVLYSFSITLAIPIILTSGYLLNYSNPTVFNYFILIVITTLIYCLKKAFLKMDNFRKTL